MVADDPAVLAFAALVLTIPMAGCLSIDDETTMDDVETLHIGQRTEDGKTAYAIPLETPEARAVIDRSLEALETAEGPFDVSAEDPPPHVSTNVTISISFADPVDRVEARDAGAVDGVDRIQLAVTMDEPNLLLGPADGNGTYLHAAVNASALEEAAEDALDQVRAENGGELPRSNVTIERHSEDSKGQNETAGNSTADGE